MSIDISIDNNILMLTRAVDIVYQLPFAMLTVEMVLC